MRHLVLTLASALLAIGAPGWCLAQPCVIEQNDDVRAHGLLSWSDFLSRTHFGGAKLLDPRVAEIAMILRLEYRVDVSVAPQGGWVARPNGLCVSALMVKSLSRVKRGERSRVTLAHEQGHFDIAEHFAREMYARLLRVEQLGDRAGEARDAVEGEIRAQYRHGMEAWRAMEHRYDRETRHGCRRWRQAEWKDLIQELLE